MILFHVGVPAVSGGFVGVDVFFVISGFLITGFIVAARESDEPASLTDFYARRVRRLLPAGLVVLIAAHAVSRAAIAYPLLAFSPVQNDGLGVRVGKPSDNDVWLTIGIGAALAFLLLLGKGFFAAIIVPALAVAAAWAASQWIAKRLGGYTGDTLGAVQQVAEIAFLVVAALFIAR